MRRRDFIAAFGGAAATWPLAASAQQPDRMRRIGILMPYPISDAEIQTRIQVFRRELARLGWSDGGNVQFDERWSTDNMDMVRADATDLVALNPDVILISGDRVIPVLAKLTSSIPIVVAITTDPLASDVVESLARPGRNVTGFSSIEFSIFGKWIETLKRIVPGISHVGMIYNPDNPHAAAYLPSFETGARQFAVQPVTLPIHGLADVERAIAGIGEQPNGGILFAPDLTIVSLRMQVVALVARHRVPAIFFDPVFVAAGALVSYGADRVVMFQQAATYVDRILRGEKAGELPFQQPTIYRLVINLKTAKALGLTVPDTLLVAADEVIE